MKAEVTLQTGTKVTGAMGEYFSFDDPTEVKYRARIMPVKTETRLGYGQPQGEKWWKVYLMGAVTVTRGTQRLVWTNNSDKILLPVDPQYTPDALNRETCVVVKEELS
ncbi:unnamed protein product [marine sediment metagenome]|uniref:Uncharacterized protein n=1 Tax=marine sediment metagenome TaxID=412755 RepID=X1MPN8_9ZZZZ